MVLPLSAVTFSSNRLRFELIERAHISGNVALAAAILASDKPTAPVSPVASKRIKVLDFFNDFLSSSMPSNTSDVELSIDIVENDINADVVVKPFVEGRNTKVESSDMEACPGP